MVKIFSRNILIKSSYIFLEKDYIVKLDQDNNKSENFNKITIPRYEKKKLIVYLDDCGVFLCIKKMFG